jgi:hypothetical protein
MGENAAQTVKEIEDTRDRLESEIRELEDRLPSPALWTKRLVGLAVGGGVGGSMFWFLVRRARSKRKAKKAVEAASVNAVIQVVPEEWGRKISDALEDGRWKPWAAAALGGWALFRMAELRQHRRMSAAMLVSRARAV